MAYILKSNFINFDVIYMKLRNYLLEKILLLVLYIDSLAIFEKQYFLILSFFLGVFSLYLEGARPYTPLIIIIAILSYF